MLDIIGAIAAAVGIAGGGKAAENAFNKHAQAYADDPNALANALGDVGEKVGRALGSLWLPCTRDPSKHVAGETTDECGRPMRYCKACRQGY